MTDRKIITELFIKTLERNIASSQEGIEMQKDYLADQPGPMQSRYDSALVEGQWQLSEMKKSLDEMQCTLSLMKELKNIKSDIIVSGSLVILNQNNSHNGYFILDAKGAAGASVIHEGRKYTVITTQSPLGKVLMGRKSGETAEFKTSRVMRCKIEEVC